jgi:hypothetical protein
MVADKGVPSLVNPAINLFRTGSLPMELPAIFTYCIAVYLAALAR